MKNKNIKTTGNLVWLIIVVLFAIAALVYSKIGRTPAKTTEQKPKATTAQQREYTDKEIQQMFQIIKQVVYGRILEGKSPYPSINERFVIINQHIYATYHTNVFFQCSSNRYGRCDAVAGSRIDSNGRPNIEIFLPSVIDYAQTITDRNTNTIEQQTIFFDFLLIATMHELEHLMEPIPTKITKSNMIELETSAWARTCEHECKPLIAMHRELPEPARKLYNVWVAANGDAKSSQWRNVVHKLMEKYDVEAMPK